MKLSRQDIRRGIKLYGIYKLYTNFNKVLLFTCNYRFRRTSAIEKIIGRNDSPFSPYIMLKFPLWYQVIKHLISKINRYI